MPRRTRALLLLAPLIAALVAGACGSPTEPRDPKVEFFTGNLAPGGTAAFGFTTKFTENVSITLVSLVPLNTIAVGIGLGAPEQGACSLLETNSSVRVGDIVGEQIANGDWCVAIYDVGAVTETVVFVLKVEHF